MRPGSALSLARVTLAAFALLAAAMPVRAQLTQRTLTYQGSTRTWFEHLPTGYDGSRAVALVVALHGYSDKGDQFAVTTGWEPVADVGGFIVVFPNGGLTVGGDFGWNNFVFDGSAPDDVGFLLALIARLEADYRVDANRVFMTGFSNGAGMTHNFAGIHGPVLAGLGVVSGGWLTGFGVPVSDMQPGEPLPVWVWGSNPGDDFDNGSETMAQEEQDQLQWWIDYDGDGAMPATTVGAPLTTSVYPGGGAEVRYTAYASDQHAFQPGTAQKIWTDFFSSLSKTSTHPAPTTFAAWQAQHFTPAQIADPSVSADAANPGRDGLCNLLKYAFGLDPTKPGAGGQPTTQMVKAGGSTYLALSFRRANVTTDLTYTVETCPNPAAGTWTAGGVAVGVAVDNGDGTSMVVYRDTAAMGATGARWMRLRITRQP